MPPTPRKDDHAALATALDHTWHWFELFSGQGIQAINFFMLTEAVLSAGYISALNAKLYTGAAAISAVGMAASAGAGLVARRMQQIARLADEPIMAIQDRLASALGIESLRMMESHRTARKTTRWFRRSSRLAFVGMAAMTVFSFGGLLFALAGH